MLQQLGMSTLKSIVRADPRTKDQAVAAAISKISCLTSMAKFSRARECPARGFQMRVTSR